MSEPANYPHNRLSYFGAYTCPACRHGEIAAMPLMEAFACNFCHHIFTANLEQQILKMTDSQLPLSWRWTGIRWQGIQREGSELNGSYWVAGAAFVLLPTLIVGLGAYLFPPLPGSRLSWLPLFWTGLTFVFHLACLVWLLLEYYQFPLLLYLSYLPRRLLSRPQ
jgi:hypothetical protein